MAGRQFYKTPIEKDVYKAAIERFELLYSRYDKVVVAFSGGKDSTACLNLALEVAHRRNRLPVEACFFDEEAISPDTHDYVERVASRDDVKLNWLCLEIEHRNACSRLQPHWVTWAPEDEYRWVRPLPARALTTWVGSAWSPVEGRRVPCPYRRGMQMHEFAPAMYGPEHGTVAFVRGLRADESTRRFRAVCRRDKDNWISKEPQFLSCDGDSWRLSSGPRGNTMAVSPIYDWTTVDVWTAPQQFGWDYNRSYDVMKRLGVSPHMQRVCPPFGEEPLAALWMYAQGWPELWDRMIARVDGAATAGRYSRTVLYGFGKTDPPPGLTFREWTFRQIETYPADMRKELSASIARVLKWHAGETKRPISEKEPDPLTGLSWSFIAGMVMRGDLKGRRIGTVLNKARQVRIKKGLTLEEVMDEEAGRHY